MSSRDKQPSASQGMESMFAKVQAAPRTRVGLENKGSSLAGRTPTQQQDLGPKESVLWMPQALLLETPGQRGNWNCLIRDIPACQETKCDPGRGKVPVGRRLGRVRGGPWERRTHPREGKDPDRAASCPWLRVLRRQRLFCADGSLRAEAGLPPPAQESKGGWDHPSDSFWLEGNKSVFRRFSAHIKSPHFGNFLLAFPGCVCLFSTDLKVSGRTCLI